MNKTTTLLALILVFGATLVSAQIPDWKTAIAQTADAKGANVFLQTEKAILEPGESSNIRIHLMVDQTTAGDDSPTQEDILRIDSDNPLYAVKNWRIDSGGGNLITPDDAIATYTAPAVRSAAKFAEISVELTPKIARLPKLIVKTRLYLDKNETAFVLTIPDYGWTNLKLTHTLNEGVKLPDVAGYPAGNVPPAARRQLEEARRKLSEMNKNGGPQKLTTNGFAVLNDEDFTAIKLTDLKIVANADDRLEQTAGTSYVEIKYKGPLAPGVYELGMTDSRTGVGMLIGGIGVGCGDLGEDTAKYACMGQLTVEKVDEKYLYGSVRATVWSSRPFDKHGHRGTFYGKFKVWKAAK